MLILQLFPRPKWDGLGLEANVNDYVDDTIQMIVPFIQANGLDPMDLPDVVEGFQVVSIYLYTCLYFMHSYFKNIENQS